MARPPRPVLTNTAAVNQTTRAYNWAAGVRLGVTSVSAQSAALPAGEVLLYAKERCYITFGANPVAASGDGSVPMEAGEKFHIQIPAGGGKIGVVRDAVDGSLYILPVA